MEGEVLVKLRSNFVVFFAVIRFSSGNLNLIVRAMISFYFFFVYFSCLFVNFFNFERNVQRNEDIVRKFVVEIMEI